MEPLKHSWAATQLEGELRDLFIKLYQDAMGEKADEINVYGAPHIGPFSLVEREVARDGLAVLRTTDEDALRYLFKAWRFQNPRRGMHFLRTYLQVLFGDNHKVMQLWQQKNRAYPTVLRPADQVVGTPLEASHWLTSRIRVDIDADYVPAQLKKTLRTALPARLVMDVRAAKYGQSSLGMVGRAGLTTVMRSGNIEPPPKYVAPPESGSVSQMLYDLWSFIQRATGQTAINNGMPMLITAEGMVKNNQFTGGALGGYTADGVTSSEGISLLMRGVANAYKFDKDAEKLAYMKFLMDAACKYYFFDTRPTADASTPWYHTWMVNAGPAFDVRGPLAANGQLDQGGYIGKAATFVNGVGYLTPAPDILYQVATEGTKFVWNNVFSDIVEGTGSSVAVEYYINAAGHKVFGTQKGGSFGQPIQENSGETPGKVVLTTGVTGNLVANYAVTVLGETVAYGDVYEAWPMWRKLAPTERSIAADAIHWFVDAFRIMREMEPTNPEWQYAHERMLDVWRECCDQESNTTSIFVPGASGQYNNFPLTYSYGYGVDNVDDESTKWEAVPPSDKYTAARTTDGYVTFTAPAMSSEKGTGGPMRYGIVFENDPVFLNYTEESSIYLDMRASEQMVVAMTIQSDEGESFEATVLAPVNAAPVNIGIAQFMRFQQEPGDATGDRTGDWDTWEMPIYDRVPFPGRRLAIVGDSISAYNSVHVDPNSAGRYETYGFGQGGYWTHADQILGGRLVQEPAIEANTNGTKRGNNFAIASTKVENWWLEEDDVLNDGVIQMGPMFAALSTLSSYDVVLMMGGTNDLAANKTAAEVLLNLKKASTDLAKNGKWVFLLTISPRTRDLLKGYTLEQQDAIRARLEAVNEGLRTWVATDDPGNIFLVDTWDLLVGPNGIDPAGLVSSSTDPNAASERGNYRTDAPNVLYMHDGLHPGPAGGYAMGKKVAEVMVLAGVPARVSATTLGPYTLGTNLLANPNMVFTQFSMETTPPSYNYTNTGWATGLGAHLTTGENLHNGYTHGKIPDNWHFYLATNATDQQIGYGTGGTYSNFQAYTWADLAGQFPTLNEYMDDSTWAPGAVKVSIITDGGAPALRVDVNIPQTGNKNEAFVLATFIPQFRHGPWDNYGYITPDNGNNPPLNTLYGQGDVLVSEMDMTMTGLNHSLVSCRLTLNLYGNSPSQDGANMTGLGNHASFWPPSDYDNCRMHPENRSIKLRAPAIRVPVYESGATMRYAELRLEVSFDASSSGATASFIIKNPSVRKLTGI